MLSHCWMSSVDSASVIESSKLSPGSSVVCSESVSGLVGLSTSWPTSLLATAFTSCDTSCR